MSTLVTLTGVVAGLDRRLCPQPIQIHRTAGHDAGDSHDADVPRHDVAVATLYILIAKLHLVDTFLGLLVFYVSTALPFCIWQMKGFYDTIPPSLEEAAHIDGCSRASSFLAYHPAHRRARAS